MNIFSIFRFPCKGGNIRLEIRTIDSINSFKTIFIALLGNTGLQLFVQVASVPLLLHFLGFEQYSLWLIATNIAQIANILDLGTLASSQNSFTFLARKKQITKLINRIKQFWNIILVTYTITLLAGVFLYFTTDFPVLLAAIFLFSNLIQVVFGLYEGLTRIENKVAKGLNASNLLRLVEFLGLILGLFLFEDSIFLIAFGALVLKSLAAVVLILRTRNSFRILYFGRFSAIETKELIKEGFPFLMIRVADFVMLSGTLLILQKHFSPVEIVFFVTARTFFRLGLQITSLVNHTYSYSMSSVWADQNLTQMTSLIKKSQIATIFLSSIGAILYLTTGTFLYGIWTHHSMSLSISLLFLGSIYSAIMSISQGQKTQFNAINLNSRVSYIQLAISFFQLIITFVFGASLNVYKMFLSLIFSECLSLWFVWVLNRDAIKQHFEQSS